MTNSPAGAVVLAPAVPVSSDSAAWGTPAPVSELTRPWTKLVVAADMVRAAVIGRDRTATSAIHLFTDGAAARLVAKLVSVSGIALSAADLQRTEEVADLERSRLGRIRSVDDVPLDRGGERPSERAVGRLRRVSRAHDVPQAADHVLPLEDHRDARAGGHEPRQAREERALAVDRVERLALLAREADHLHADDPESFGLEAPDDLSDDTLMDAVRLHDAESPL